MPDEKNVIQLELKICERCAAYWLRPAGRNSRYCHKCVRLVEEVSTAPLKRAMKRSNARGWRKRKEAA